MLPFLVSVWETIHRVMADPAFTAALEILLIPIVYYEVRARLADKQHLKIAKETYELYKTYFETTEKRKAEAREKAAATRAAKKAAKAEEVPGEPPPVPPEGEVPPPMSMPDDEPEEEQQ